jgi:hypothetical protein
MVLGVNTTKLSRGVDDFLTLPLPLTFLIGSVSLVYLGLGEGIPELE